LKRVHMDIWPVCMHDKIGTNFGNDMREHTHRVGVRNGTRMNGASRVH
jgi:hypothetical protein